MLNLVFVKIYVKNLIIIKFTIMQSCNDKLVDYYDSDTVKQCYYVTFLSADGSIEQLQQ